MIEGVHLTEGVRSKSMDFPESLNEGNPYRTPSLPQKALPLPVEVVEEVGEISPFRRRQRQKGVEEEQGHKTAQQESLTQPIESPLAGDYQAILRQVHLTTISMKALSFSG